MEQLFTLEIKPAVSAVPRSEIAVMERKAARMEEEAEELREEALRLENQADRVRSEIEKLQEEEATLLAEVMREFFAAALAEKLAFDDVRILEMAQQGEAFKKSDLLRIGLRHNLRIPADLFPARRVSP